MISSQALEKLGFKHDVDFDLVDSGNGVEIEHWKKRITSTI